MVAFKVAAPAAAPASAPAPAPAPEVEVAAPAPASEGAMVFAFPRWGTLGSSSALASKMAKDQMAYIEKYGSTLQKPVA